jgi:hypothetical protein
MTATHRTLALFLAAGSPIAANPYLWTGAGATFNNLNWTNSNNWSPSTPPKALTSDIVLAGSQSNGVGNPPLAPEVNEPWTVRSLQLSMTPGAPYHPFDNPTWPAHLNGQEITLGAGGITNTSPFHQQINNPIRVAANQSWDDGFNPDWDAPVILNGPIHFATPAIAAYYELTLNGGSQDPDIVGHIQIRNDITGTGRLTVTSGTRLRIGDNATAVDAPDSIVRIQSGGVMFLPRNTAATVNLGTLDLQTGGIARLRGNLHNLSVLQLQGGGTLVNDDPAGSVPGVFRHLGTGNQTFAGSFSGSPDFTKSGTGTLSFTRSSGTNVLRQLQLNAGTLVLDNNTALNVSVLGGTGNLEVRAGSSFRGEGAFQGTISGAGQVTFSGSLALPGLVTHSAGALIVNEELTLGPSHSFHAGSLSGSGLVRLDSNAELKIGGSSTFNGILGNLGTLANPRGKVTVEANQLLTLEEAGGQHAFDQLLLKPGAEARVSAGGQLLVRAFPEPSGILGASRDGVLLLAENPSHPFRAAIAASDGIVTLGLASPLQLLASGATHRIKQLNLSSTGLILRGGSTLIATELNGSANLRIDPGATANITKFATSGFAGGFQDGPDGPGTLALSLGNGNGNTKVLRAGNFSGPVTLGGNGTYQTQPGTSPSGPITIGGGAELEATEIDNTSVTLNSGGRLQLTSIPSPAGPVYGGCITGSYHQTTGATLAIEISDRPSRLGGSGRVRASGNLTLGGSLEVTLNNTFGAQPGDQWIVCETTGGTLSGFIFPGNVTTNTSNLPPGTRLELGQTATTLTLTLVADATDPPGYYTWATANNLTPANRGPFLDADLDGIPNWREYLLGLNPLASASPSAPDHELRTEAGQPIVRFRLSPAVDFTNDFEVQGSSDLGITDTWSSTKATFLGNGTLPDTFLYRDYRFHLPPSTAPRGFLRIRYKGLTSHPDD